MSGETRYVEVRLTQATLVAAQPKTRPHNGRKQFLRVVHGVTVVYVFGLSSKPSSY